MSGFVARRGREGDDVFLRRRGPDGRRELTVEDFSFTHYLLRSDSGAAGDPASSANVLQNDILQDDVVCLWDGAIYDRPADRSAGRHLVDLYRRHGEDFVRHLDAELAVVLYDFSRRILVAATDAFGTKPLFLRGAEASSYRSALGGGERLAPDTLAVVDLDDGEADVSVVEPFEFDRQHKESYDDWIVAFERAVEKRAVEGCYVPLSAGYDSGGIDCALSRLGLAHKTFSLEGKEDVDLIRRRIDRRTGRSGEDGGSGEILPMDAEIFARWSDFLDARCEPARFRVTIFTGEEEEYEVHGDRASRGLAQIHARARAEGRRVFLSGHGVDETLAACRHWPEARFPQGLRPWPDFQGNWQTAYLAKEELVAGACGVEGRYPYLDRAVVQEFLWLDAELKSRPYKAPLHEYMRRHGYPFGENVKTGFNPLPGRA